MTTTDSEPQLETRVSNLDLPGLISDIQRDARLAEEYQRWLVVYAARIGFRLRQIQQSEVPYGSWERFVHQHFGWTRQWAATLMRLAEALPGLADPALDPDQALANFRLSHPSLVPMLERGVKPLLAAARPSASPHTETHLNILGEEVVNGRQAAQALEATDTTVPTEALTEDEIVPYLIGMIPEAERDEQAEPAATGYHARYPEQTTPSADFEPYRQGFRDGYARAEADRRAREAEQRREQRRARHSRRARMGDEEVLVSNGAAD